jgi:hypothetical protein
VDLSNSGYGLIVLMNGKVGTIIESGILSMTRPTSKKKSGSNDRTYDDRNGLTVSRQELVTTIDDHDQ